MSRTYQEAISGQFEAALATLRGAIEQCPEADWEAPVIELTFNQAAFHALFFADVYLGRDLDSLRLQSFHIRNAAHFRDYEELEAKRQQASYDRAFLREYSDHCRSKVQETLEGETASDPERRPGFDWLNFSRAEVHAYNVRHLQHHAAQLSLWLKLRGSGGVEWVRTGWREP